MTDKEKLEKLVAYLVRRMYAHNQKADIGSVGEVFDEKIENAKYEECKDTLNFIDSMQEEPKKCMYSKDNYTDEDRKVFCDGCEEECKFKPTTSVWHDGNEKPLNDKYVLAYIEPGYFEVGRHAGVIDSFYYGSFATDWEHIIKWAHIDDILKL